MTIPHLRTGTILLCLLAAAGCADRQEGAQPPPPITTTDSQPTTPGETMSQSKMNVLGYRYHADTRILSIKYTGGIYRYAAVPQSVYDAWVAAGANGGASDQNLSGKFTAVYVQPGSQDQAIDP
jgi:hypothetical protein